MLSNFGSPRARRIAYVVLACLIPAVLLIVIFNFIQYEQSNATHNIPVAVVNEDKNVTSNGQVINMGEQVVSTLKKDHQVKWEFMDSATAQKKLKSGAVYLEIKLPKNFSANAGTALDKSPKVSAIDVYKSKKNNYVSTMVSNTVAETVQNQVKTSLQKAYSSTLLSGVKKLSTGTTQAAGGTQQLADGMVQLKDGNIQIVRNLDLLSSKMIEFEAGATTLDNGTKTYTSGVKTYSDGVNTYVKGVDTLAVANTQMLNGIQQLSDQSQPLVSGAAQLNDGAQQVAQGASDLSDGISSFQNGINDGNPDDVGIDKALQQLKSGVDNDTTLSDMIPVMNQARTDSEKVQTDLASMNSAIDTLKTLAPLLDQVNGAKTQISSLQKQLTMATMLSKSQATVATDTQNQKDTQTALDAEIAKVSDPTEKAALQAASSANATAATKLATDASTNASVIKLVTSQSATALSDFSTKLAGATLTTDDANQMITQVQGIITEANSLFAETKPLLSTDTVNKLQSSTATLSTGITHIQSVSDAALAKLEDGSGQLKAGSAKLATGTKQLSDQTPSLIDGVKQLLTGATKINSGSQQLTAASPQLKSGGTQLNSASSQLTSGTSQIVTATQTAASGSAQLASGSHQVQDGIVQAFDGTNTLNTALQDGVKQLTPVNDTSKNTNHFASPISTTDVGATTTSLKNTFAPLVLALVLFIGAVVTQLGLFNPRKRNIKLAEEPLLAIGLTAVVQAIVADALIGILGVTVSNWIGLGFFTLIVSVFFTAITMLLYHIFGRVGVLFAVLLALVQIIITGQLFPNAMLSSFYQAVASVLPMTHAIHGFENLINGSNYNLILAIAGLAVFTAVLAGIAYGIDLLLNSKQVADEGDNQD